mgnify:FL=1|tara:strand:+ start:2739 stop:3404 length:666 start_codon:yes stop_codon:yes gene_type:complete
MAVSVTIENNVGFLKVTRAERKTIRSTLNELKDNKVHAVAIRIEANSINDWNNSDFQWLRKLYPLPIVAALVGQINGTEAFFSLSCDLRVGENTGTLTLPESDNKTYLNSLKQLIGPQKSPPKANTCIEMEKALTLGLISRITSEKEGSWALSQKVARTIASRGKLATRLAKEAVWRGLDIPLEQALRYETDLTLLLQTTKDRKEGVRAFVEKRSPNFTGD